MQCSMDDIAMLDGWEALSYTVIAFLLLLQSIPCLSVSPSLPSACFRLCVVSLRATPLAAFLWSKLSRSSSHGSDEGRRRVYSHLQASAHAPCKLTPLSSLLSSPLVLSILLLRRCLPPPFFFLPCTIFFTRGDAANPRPSAAECPLRRRLSCSVSVSREDLKRVYWAVWRNWSAFVAPPRFSIFLRSGDVVLFPLGVFDQDLATRFVLLSWAILVSDLGSRLAKWFFLLLDGLVALSGRILT